MRSVNKIPDLVFLFYFNQKFAFFIFWFHERRSDNIALAERGMFQKLTEFVTVTFRCVDWRMAFQNEKYIVFIAQFNLVNCSARNYQIIATFKFDVSYKSLQRSGSVMHVEHFVALGIFIEIIG